MAYRGLQSYIGGRRVMITSESDSRVIACKVKYEGLSCESLSYGKFIIIDYRRKNEVLIRFIGTGYELITSMAAINTGRVKDKLYPKTYGVGFIGEGNYKTKIKGVVCKSSSVWRAMLSRCYSPDYQERNPTYKGCTVVEEWHNFQNFAKWFDDSYIEGYHLDKDIKVEGNKVYGPDTCMFVSSYVNNEKAHAKHCKVVTPEGKCVEVYNMKAFCRRHGIDQAAMGRVVNGKAKQHKGWRKYDEQLIKVAEKLNELNYSWEE